MKTHVLFMLMLSLCSFSAVQACPVIHIANIRVIDQHGNRINNAKVYRIYGVNYSALVHYHYNRVIDQECQTHKIDSGTFALFSSGCYYYTDDKESPITNLFMIQAPGYADVSIKSVLF